MKRKLMLVCVVMLIGVFLVGGMALAANFRGTDGPDEILGTKRADAIRGLGGNDRLSGSGGADEIYGNGGSDRIFGNNGDDRLIVDDGRQDIIKCGDGYDRVYADGKDVVYYRCEWVKRPWE
jgi:Ca2+-binding RTX toxin-like protein